MSLSAITKTTRAVKAALKINYFFAHIRFLRTENNEADSLFIRPVLNQTPCDQDQDAVAELP